MEYSTKNSFLMGACIRTLETFDLRRKKYAQNIQSVIDNHLYEGLIKNYNITSFGDELSFDCYNSPTTPDLQYSFTGCYQIDTVTDLFYEKVNPMSECVDCNLHGIDVKAITAILTSHITKAVVSRELFECYVDIYPVCVKILCSGIKILRISSDQVKKMIFDSDLVIQQNS